MEIREARAEKAAEIASIFNAAYLQTDTESIRTAVESGAVLVAVDSGEGQATESNGSRERPILGALVLDGNEITEIAVRPGRRGQGIGSALVTAATRRVDGAVATFDPTVRQFWESVGFEITTVAHTDRLHGKHR